MATIAAVSRRSRRAWADFGPLAHLDVALLSTPIVLSGFGLLMIYDSSRNRLAQQGLSRLYYVERQGVAIALGLVAMAVVMAIDYRRIRDTWVLVYVAVLPLLGGVLVVGRNHGGAQAWFQLGPMQFQPSEVAKIAVVVAIAGYCHLHRGDLDAWRLAVVLSLAGVVMAIVYLQHDLGTMLVIMVCSISVLVVAGLKPVHLGVLLLLGATLVGAAVVSGRVDAYQVDRLRNFLDQSTEGTSASQQTQTQYSLQASKTAIASGGLTGAGIFEGLQTKNGFVPEQHTDFIFTAVGEELGFVGGAMLLALYALLAWRCWRIALLSSDFFGTLVAIGVLAMFAIQVFENIGMTMGIMPITGIPLPFMSYGGSSIIASFMAVGLVLNVHMRRFS
jgi:rod shape determining protein RodA